MSVIEEFDKAFKSFEALINTMTVNTNNDTRLQVRTTQTAGDPVDSDWKIVYDTGGIPRPITVSNVTASTPVGMPISIALSAMDPTPNPMITFSIVQQPTNGTLSTIVNNVVTYTPNTTFNGIDVFTYTASDQIGLKSKPGTVTVTVGTTPTNVMGTIAIFNFSKLVTDAQVQQWMVGIQQQCDTDVSKIWGKTVKLVFLPQSQSQNPPAGYWLCGVFDNTTQAGVLGWHQVGRNGEPLMYIFVETAKQAGVDPATVLSHEVIESIGDPNVNTVIPNCLDQNGKACAMFQELCDAVENDVYVVGGINVSNFVSKNWFIQNSTGPYDALSKLVKPFTLDSGGYMEVSYDGGRTWTQEVMAAKGAMAMYREMAGEFSRWAKYKTPISERKRSEYKQA